MKSTRHVFGKPLIVMVLMAVAVVMIFAGRCGHAPQPVIVSDTVFVDSASASRSDTAKVHVRSRKLRKTRPKERKVRRVVERDYLHERIDSVKSRI